jgi:hypothetical protein
MTNGRGSANPAIGLSDALALVFDAITVAEQGLLRNPSVEEERELNEQLNDLQLKRATIRAQIDALIAGTRTIAGPTAEQVAEISRLTGQVEALTSAATTASAAVAFTSRVLEVATNVIGGQAMLGGSHGGGGGSNA